MRKGDKGERTMAWQKLADSTQQQLLFRYWADFKIHIAFFKIKKTDVDLMNFMKKDKDGNTRGVVKLNLKDLPVYDKK